MLSNNKIQQGEKLFDVLHLLHKYLMSTNEYISNESQLFLLTFVSTFFVQNLYHETNLIF